MSDTEGYFILSDTPVFSCCRKTELTLSPEISSTCSFDHMILLRQNPQPVKCLFTWSMFSLWLGIYIPMGTEKAIQSGETRQRKKNNWKPGENMRKGRGKDE